MARKRKKRGDPDPSEGRAADSSDGDEENLAKLADDDELSTAGTRFTPSIASPAGEEQTEAPQEALAPEEVGSIEILIATGNRHKVREFRELLAGSRYRVISLLDLEEVPEIIEDADSFRGNAEKKARTLAELRGCITIADDSGLVVDALDGAPGVQSARYAGVTDDHADHANNEKLLEALAEVPFSARTARFVCAMAIITPDGRSAFAEGSVEGRITHVPRGDNGFGYDPLFALAGVHEGHTTAELPAEQKNAVSHRGQALRALLPALARLHASS